MCGATLCTVGYLTAFLASGPQAASSTVPHSDGQAVPQPPQVVNHRAEKMRGREVRLWSCFRSVSSAGPRGHRRGRRGWKAGLPHALLYFWKFFKRQEHPQQAPCRGFWQPCSWSQQPNERLLGGPRTDFLLRPRKLSCNRTKEATLLRGGW